MGKHKWVPDRAEYFTCHREPGSSSLTIEFFNSLDEAMTPRATESFRIEELHDVLTNDDNHRMRESVLQQIRERKDPRVESRIDIIGRNGNDGLHYDDLQNKADHVKNLKDNMGPLAHIRDALGYQNPETPIIHDPPLRYRPGKETEVMRPKQPRYQDATGDDWIDESYRTMTWEQFCGAMKFTIGKYLRRLGKKDDEVQEIEKVADYSERWLQKAKLRIREKV